MGSNTTFRLICLLMLLASVVGKAPVVGKGTKNSNTFNVRKYGAKSDGRTDNAQAFMSAWKAACASPTPSVMLIPKGNFAIGPVTFIGPCKSPIEFRLRGTMQSPTDLNKFHGIDGWVAFTKVDRLKVAGGGTFDGQGEIAWAKNKCAHNAECRQLPINIRFNFVTNSVVQGITSLNSKNFHINVLGGKNLAFDHIKIVAPDHSLNTDGIHIGRSSGINITDTNIATGDDCISIGEGSEQIYVTRITCGPGHGISIGSLGRYQNESPVIGVFVRNSTITKTMNGIRIKTWPASPPGIAKEIHFDDIIMNDVGNPILIDQGYCPYNQCKAQVPSKVQINNVSIKNIRGTSSTPYAVKLVCSKSGPCQNVEIGNINLKYKGGPAKSECANIKPRFSGKQNPPVCV